jgi:uncharacterized protein
MRVLGRRVYWRWYREVLLSGNVVLRMTGDAAKWLRPGDGVRLSTEFKKPLLGFDEYALWGRFPLWPPFAKDLEHVREGPLGGEAYRYRLRAREAQFEADFEAIAELDGAVSLRLREGGGGPGLGAGAGGPGGAAGE